jgi:hypothetical protein
MFLCLIKFLLLISFSRNLAPIPDHLIDRVKRHVVGESADGMDESDHSDPDEKR